MKKILLAILLSVFLLSAMAVPILSQDVTVGVSVGDWFVFEATIVEWIAEPDVPFPPDQYMTILYTFNETDWEKYTVTDIIGGNITFEVVTHWKNGTEITSEQTKDITIHGTFRFIPANLESGDLLRDEFDLFGLLHYPPMYLNDSITVEYETETRETNVLDYEQPTLYPEDSVHTRNLWDKETGVLIKSQNVYNNTSALGQKFFVIYEVELVETNLWDCAQPQEWTVGLSVGDWFKFKGTLVLWEGNASFPPIGMEFLQRYNESDWAEWTVTDIEGFNVTIEVTTHWKNGTVTVGTMTEDITSSGDIHIIAANLTEGTELRPETTSFGQPFGARYLNASIMREYESGARETNVVIYDWDILGNVYHVKALFDKITGMHVYFQMSTTDADEFGGGGTTYSYNATFELIETNIEGWIVIPEFPTGTVMLLIFVAVTVCIGIYRRRKLKRHIG